MLGAIYGSKCRHGRRRAAPQPLAHRITGADSNGVRPACGSTRSSHGVWQRRVRPFRPQRPLPLPWRSGRTHTAHTLGCAQPAAPHRGPERSRSLALSPRFLSGEPAHPGLALGFPVTVRPEISPTGLTSLPRIPTVNPSGPPAPFKAPPEFSGRCCDHPGHLSGPGVRQAPPADVRFDRESRSTRLARAG
jgi:hypothetical protein